MAALLEAGAEVVVLDNFSSIPMSELPAYPQLKVVTGDVRNAQRLLEAMRGATHVLHLAAQVSVQASVADPYGSCSNNIAGFVNVLETASRLGVRRVVYASSAAVYGVPQILPLDEHSPLLPISPYGLEKLVNEKYADLYRRTKGVSTLGLRYFNAYGPGQVSTSPYAGVVSLFLLAAATGRPYRVYGDGKQTRDYVFVKDIAAINVRALLSGAEGVLCVGTGVQSDLLTLGRTIGEVIRGSAPEWEFLPPKAGDIRDSVASTSLLEKVLGMVPSTPVVEGLRLVIAGGVR